MSFHPAAPRRLRLRRTIRSALDGPRRLLPARPRGVAALARPRAGGGAVSNFHCRRAWPRSGCFSTRAVFVYTTRAGKFAVWAELLDRLELKGDERLLDIGCGRGAVLLMAAQRLPRGRAVGVDVWSTTDQSGNAVQVTRKNADLEGVAERVELHTADMRHLPFDDGSFDVVVSSLAIHNVSGAGDRAALREAARVLKKGGKLAIADIRHTRVYARELESCGLKITERRSLGARFWYGCRPLGGDPSGRRDQAVEKAKPPVPQSTSKRNWCQFICHGKEIGVSSFVTEKKLVSVHFSHGKMN